MLRDKETGIRLGGAAGGTSRTCDAQPDDVDDPRLQANQLVQTWVRRAKEAGPLFVLEDVGRLKIDTLATQNLSNLNRDENLDQHGFDDVNAGVRQILDTPRL